MPQEGKRWAWKIFIATTKTRFYGEKTHTQRNEWAAEKLPNWEIATTHDHTGLEGLWRLTTHDLELNDDISKIYWLVDW